MAGGLRSTRRARLLMALGLVAGAIVATVPFATTAGATPSWSAPRSVDNTNPEAIAAVSCVSATFCLTLDSSGQAFKFNGTTWSAAAGAGGTDLFSLSCASPTFCVAGDGDGDDITYDGTSWSAPDNVDEGFVMNSVSCPTTHFCAVAAGDGNGTGAVYNGTTWTEETFDTAVVSGMTSVSCTSSTNCTAFDDVGNAVFYDGTSWSAPENIDETTDADVQVSCAGTLCLAVDDGGTAFASNGGGWTEFPNIDPNGFSSVSCASASSCVAVDVAGAALTYNGSSWSSPQSIDTDQVLDSVSCPTATFCAAADDQGNVLTDSGGTWSAPTFVDGQPTELSAVSCTASSFCVAVDELGNALTWNGANWSLPVNIESGSFNSVSCVTTSFCVAVDTLGRAFTYDGTSWTVDTVDLGHGIVSVSCATTTFCVAVDSEGNALTYNGTSWSSASIDSGPLTSVSCSTVSFCVALDAAGHVRVTEDGATSWLPPTAVDGPGNGLDSVSCAPGTTFCAAVDDGEVGNVFVSSNGFSGWSSAEIDPTTGLTSVSCASASFCVAVEFGGNALVTENGFGTWSTTDIDPGKILMSASCPSAAFCAAVDNSGQAVIDTEAAPAGLYVSKLSPFTGPVAGGTPVTISGSGFTGATEVDFGGVAGTGLMVVDDTTVSVTSPPAATAGTVDVTVVTPTGTSAVHPADQFTYTEPGSPNTTSCDPSCTNTVSTTLDQTNVTVTGSSGTAASTTLEVDTATLACSRTYNYESAVSTLTPSGFIPGAQLTVTEQVGNEPSTHGVKVCFQATPTARAKFLRHCRSGTPVPPCLQSLTEDAGRAGVTAIFVVSANDPRFWAGAAPVSVTKVSPAHGAPGAIVTVKGKNLTGVVAVVMGGAPAKIDTVSASKLMVTVPQNAVTGTVSVTSASGSATSRTAFTVNSG
jgi:hypothetical protein